MHREIKNGELVVTDLSTGEIKTVKFATDKQLSFIRSLEQQLNVEPKAYRGLTVWQAAKVIERLSSKQRPML